MPLQAILTKYLGPTNTKGARIVATTGSGISLTTGYDHALSHDDKYRAAAEALRNKLGWRGRLIAGATKDGYAFVFADDSAEIGALKDALRNIATNLGNPKDAPQERCADSLRRAKEALGEGE